MRRRYLSPNSRGAIELSANFMIVIILSAIIVIGGLALFFKMKGNAQQYVDTLDQQTEGNIKSMMLSSGGRIAVYPQDFTLSSGDAKLVGIGITNIYDDTLTLTINPNTIKFYATAESEGTPILAEDLPTYYTSSSQTVEVAPHEQVVKSIMVRMPKSAQSGQYVFTILLTNQATAESYGVIQVYVDNS
jgi:hypothetical protein